MADTKYDTTPEAFPEAPEVMVNHDALVVAVQGHPDGAVTVTELVPPAAVALALPGEIE